MEMYCLVKIEHLKKPNGLLVLGISNGSPSIADTSVPNNEIASNVNQTNCATLTITMRTVPLPEEVDYVLQELW